MYEAYLGDLDKRTNPDGTSCTTVHEKFQAMLTFFHTGLNDIDVPTGNPLRQKLAKGARARAPHNRKHQMDPLSRSEFEQMLRGLHESRLVWLHDLAFMLELSVAADCRYNCGTQVDFEATNGENAARFFSPRRRGPGRIGKNGWGRAKLQTVVGFFPCASQASEMNATRSPQPHWVSLGEVGSPAPP